MVSSVEVFHEDTHVGRLSSQISEQFIPVIEHAAKHDKLTNVWGTIRGNRLELSLTIQAVRSENIPEQWYKDLPNDVPELLPEAKKYEVPDAFVPAEAENTQGKHILPQKIRGFITSVAGKTESARRSRHTKLSQRKQLNLYLSMIFLKNTHACLPSSKL